MIERRRLGASGLEVSKLSLGAMTFGTGMPPVTTVDEDDARVMIDRALEVGVNLIDTADVYADGQSEEILGAAIRDRRDDVLVATKMGFGSRGPGALSYDNVVTACEASIARLGVDHIDLYQLHRPDRTTPIEETLPRARRPGGAWAGARDRHQQLPCLRDRGHGRASARPGPARVHLGADLLLAGRARGGARDHPAVPGRRPRRDRVEPARRRVPHRSLLLAHPCRRLGRGRAGWPADDVHVPAGRRRGRRTAAWPRPPPSRTHAASRWRRWRWPGCWRSRGSRR